MANLIKKIVENPITTITGSKYTPGQDIKEIAKLVRKDLKAAYPKAKFSVRIDRYSMGQSLLINASSGDFPMLLELCPRENGFGPDYKRLPAEMELSSELENIANAYNRRARDRHTSYDNSVFYAHVSLADILSAQLYNLREEKKAQEVIPAPKESPKLRLVWVNPDM